MLIKSVVRKKAVKNGETELAHLTWKKEKIENRFFPGESFSKMGVLRHVSFTQQL